MLLAGFLAGGFAGQALHLPPAPAVEAPVARAELTRCLAKQAARIERLEANLESVGRLAVSECDTSMKAYLHSLGAPTVGEFTSQVSEMQAQMRRDTNATLRGEAPAAKPAKSFNLPNMTETMSVTQAATAEASRDAIAAREARLSSRGS